MLCVAAVAVFAQSAAEGMSTDRNGAGVALVVAVDDATLTTTELKTASELLEKTAALLPSGTLFSVVSFASEKRIQLPFTSDAAAAKAALLALKPQKRGVGIPDGLFDSLQAADRNAEATAGKAQAVLLFAGGVSAGGDVQIDDAVQFSQLRRIPVYSVGFGQNDGRDLRRISKLTTGEYVRIEVADAHLLATSITAGTKQSAARLASAAPGAAAAANLSPPQSVPPSASANRGLFALVAAALALVALLALGAIVFLMQKRAPVRPGRAVAVPASQPASSSAHARHGLTQVARDIDSDSSPTPPAIPALIDDGPTSESVERTIVVPAEPTLQGLTGSARGTSFRLRTHTTIGRSRSNDIALPQETSASAHHCRIDRKGQSYTVTDVGSTNGTWVNDEKITTTTLKHGDKLRIGGSAFLVSLLGERT